MDKFNSTELIISRPEKIKPIRKLSELTVTMAFWIIVFYLWQPLISFIAWSFGVSWYYEHMVTLGGKDKIIGTLISYLYVIIAMGGGLVLWAMNNKWRFKNVNRRSKIPNITPENIAEHFQVDSQVVKTLINAKNVSLLISDNFEIESKINDT